MSNPIKDWHTVVQQKDYKLLKSLLHKNAVFYSPLVFKAQEGRALALAYLTAASNMFEGTGFHYVKEVIGENEAVLEFNAQIDGIQIDGVDIITWDQDGKITEFKVMLRPFKAIEKVGEKMKAQLESMTLWDKLKLKINS